MNATHTPGPWSYHPDKTGFHNSRILGGNERLVTQLPEPRGGLLNERNANARLIASASDLLAACKMALSCMRPDDDDITAKSLRAAIAKATGE